MRIQAPEGIFDSPVSLQCDGAQVLLAYQVDDPDHVFGVFLLVPGQEVQRWVFFDQVEQALKLYHELCKKYSAVELAGLKLELTGNLPPAERFLRELKVRRLEVECDQEFNDRLRAALGHFDLNPKPVSFPPKAKSYPSPGQRYVN